MRPLAFSIFLVGLAAVSPQASASTGTLGLSTQTVTFTGIGGDPTGAGQNTVNWGSCAFDGTNTTCTVSGPYTGGLGSGGTYNYVLTYPGNGPSPLKAVSQSPGNNLIFFQLSAGSFTTSYTETNGTTIQLYDPAFEFFFAPGSTCTGVASCAVGQVGLTVGSTITGPVSGTFDPTPHIRASLGVISASQYGAFSSIAPATWIEIFGTNLATTPQQVWGKADFNGDLAPTAVGGTSVTVGGMPAFVYYVSPHQVDVQVPTGVEPGQQPVVVTTVGGASAASVVTVNRVEPGLLAPVSFRLKGIQYVTALFPDGVTYVLPPEAIPALPSTRARPGDTIMLYGIGFGPVTPDTPAGQIVRQNSAVQATFQVFFAGTPATVTYSGLVQGYLGLYQFNVVVPNVDAGDAVPVTFTLGGAAGQQTLSIAIQK